MANLAFLDEIWPHTPGAQHVIILIMLAAVLADSCQLVSLLYGWVLNYAGPWWARLLFRMVVMPAVVGYVLVVIIALIYIVVIICINV